IKPGELMAVAISTAVINDGDLDPTGANFIPKAAMFFGIDADKAAKMIELDFRDDKGNSAPQSQQAALMRQACDELKLGRHIIITDEYRRLLGKKRGDTLTI